MEVSNMLQKIEVVPKGPERRSWERRQGWSTRYRVSAVIPALNEAENLPHVLPRIPTWVHEVILVDGQSSDDTVQVAQELWPTIRIVPQAGRGKGAALRSGFAAASGDIIAMLDADGSTDPAEIPAFVGALLSVAIFAYRSRFLKVCETVVKHLTHCCTVSCIVIYG